MEQPMTYILEKIIKLEDRYKKSTNRKDKEKILEEISELEKIIDKK